jgi:hypothetical protein
MVWQIDRPLSTKTITEYTGQERNDMRVAITRHLLAMKERERPAWMAAIIDDAASVSDHSRNPSLTQSLDTRDAYRRRSRSYSVRYKLGWTQACR